MTGNNETELSMREHLEAVFEEQDIRLVAMGRFYGYIFVVCKKKV